MRINENFIERWEHIIKNVDVTDVPVECIKKAVIKFSDGTQKTVNIRNLKKQNLTPEEIEVVLNRILSENQDRVRSMEFVLDVEAVAEILQPETDKLLKGM